MLNLLTLAMGCLPTERAMSIRQYLIGVRFDSETMRILGVALEMARCALRFEERGDEADAAIANHIIALAQAGERDADRLCDYALAKLREVTRTDDCSRGATDGLGTPAREGSTLPG